MLFVVVIVIPGTFTFLIWNSYRKERSRSARGEGYAPEGRLRWQGEEN